MIAGYDITHVLLTIILVLTVVVGVGLVVLLTLLITTLLEFFALIKSVNKEISSITSALRMVGEGIAGRVGSAFGLLDFFKAKPAKKTVVSKKKVVKKK
jgi:hypothetical protein